MKKLFLPIIASLALFMTSCIGGDVYETTSGSDLDLITTTIAVQPNQWYIDGTPGQEGAALVSEWTVRELDQSVKKYGMVQVSYYFYDDQNHYVEHPLPYILPYYDNPTNVLENLRCFIEYDSHTITFVLESSDFQCYPREVPYMFKVSILKPR
ncbi:MAG: hypothetical protein IKQ94_00705 [Bacteroidales bacterium]|nr:hypothetical protein [Bacteroidales bacterium]